MRNKLEKMAVFSLLQNRDSGLSLSEIYQLLGSAHSERTLRRWLAEMKSEGLIVSTGKKRSTRYRVIISTELPTGQEQPIFFTEKSIKVRDSINRSLFERNPVSYNPQWLDIYIPNQTSYLSEEIKLQLHRASGENKTHLPAGTYARQIYNRLLIDLSYNSSRLEGNTYSLLDTERLILEGADVPGKLDEEKIMILNHKEAIAYMINNAQQIKLDVNTIYTLHYLLADGLIPARYAGKIRDYGVRISGSVYIPWENPDKLKVQLEAICYKAALIQDPFEQSIFLLAHLAYLQAFYDVNKRTSRLSANIPLITHNLIPLSFNDVSKTDYQAAMIAIYELNDIHMLIELYVHSYLRTCQLYKVTLDVVNYDEVRVRYRQQRRDIIRYIITHQLINQDMWIYISEETKKHIGKKDQADFMHDIEEDLQEISAATIAGLGVTIYQLEEWLKLRKTLSS